LQLNVLVISTPYIYGSIYRLIYRQGQMGASPNLRLVPPKTPRTTRQRYLQWFEPTRSWRFRRLVPEKLRSIIGLTEWTETLSARTENEAIRLVLPHIEKTDRIIALAEGGNWPPVPDEDIEIVAWAWWVGGRRAHR
jgi:hypothetical protein